MGNGGARLSIGTMRIASKLAEWLKKRSVDQRGMAGDINGVEQRVEQRVEQLCN